MYCTGCGYGVILPYCSKRLTTPCPHTVVKIILTLFHFRDAEKVNFDNYERGKQDVYLYHEEHLPYKTTIRKMRPPVRFKDTNNRKNQ